jgi:hypothetical protein
MRMFMRIFSRKEEIDTLSMLSGSMHVVKGSFVAYHR